MSYGVFFSIEALGRKVGASSPEYCSGTDTAMELLASLSSEGDFFGLIDEDGTCLQVRFEDSKNSYWFEVPRPDLSGSYGAYYSYDAAAKAVENLPGIFPEAGLDGFKFSSW
ncbi:MAG: hypothetical protein QNJ19_11435 [Woeseiaceae bacterium]|nr:hypothetical protein [Woeseiaceae bacterium]